MDASAHLGGQLRALYHENDPFLRNIGWILSLRHLKSPVDVDQVLRQFFVVVETGLRWLNAHRVCVGMVQGIAASAASIGVLAGGVLEAAHALFQVLVDFGQIVV